jgi:Transcription factor DP/E2F/DP family winged-helix DNA-binding domain
VYDALNVLMAMGVISKVKKQITWNGLPSNTRRDLDMLERQIEEKRQSITEKRQHLEELLVQSISYRNVVEKNKRANEAVKAEEKIPIPFIIVNTSTSTRACVSCLLLCVLGVCGAHSSACNRFDSA